MNYDRRITGPLIRRLPIYHRSLTALLQLGFRKISSRDLGNVMGITSSQVRQDFSNFGGNGLQGYGYDVEYLLGEIEKILGMDIVQNIIIIGAGSLGQALAKHASFEKKGFKIIGIFDVSTQLVGKRIRDIEIRHFDSLSEFVKSNKVDIAAITVPEAYANEVVSLAVKLGIRGLWNFTPVELKVPEGVIIENIHLSDSLIVLGYKLLGSKEDSFNQAE